MTRSHTRDSELLQVLRPLPEVAEGLKRDAARRPELGHLRVVLLGVVGVVLAEGVRTTALLGRDNKCQCEQVTRNTNK